MSEPGFPDEPKPKWADLWGIDPHYDETTEAAERKRLAETTYRLGYELGRKEAQGECAAMLEDRASGMAGPSAHLLLGMAQTIRNIASRPQGAPSEPRTHPDGHTDLPEDAKPPQEPCEDPACPVPLMHSHPQGLPGDGE